MNIRPLHDRILIRRLEEGEQTIGRIIIPDTAKEKPQQGQVIAVGKGKMSAKGQRVPLAVQAGDRILFGKYAQEITLAGQEYLILREEEILAVMDSDKMKKKAGNTAPKAAPKKAIAKKISKTRKTTKTKKTKR